MKMEKLPSLNDGSDYMNRARHTGHAHLAGRHTTWRGTMRTATVRFCILLNRPSVPVLHYKRAVRISNPLTEHYPKAVAGVSRNGTLGLKAAATVYLARRLRVRSPRPFAQQQQTQRNIPQTKVTRWLEWTMRCNCAHKSSA